MNHGIRQRTLKNVIRATGVGLHTGAQVLLTLRPAAPDSGVVFVRTDLEPAVRIPARMDAVGGTRLATTLGCEGASVGNVEHLLAALSGLGIDNVLVEVDAPELPIMDGSAGPFVFLLESAGVVEQDAPKRFVRVLKPVRYREGDALAELRPHDGFRVEYTLLYDHPVLESRRKTCAVEVSPSAFVREIARARTFGFLSDQQRRQVVGLARRGGPDNVVLLDAHRVSHDSGLRLGDEFVRHKLLDAIGDLYLLGHGLIGAFSGFRSGHSTNRGLVLALLADATAWEWATFADAAELPGRLGRRMPEIA